MAGQFDANVKLLYATDDNTFFTVDEVDNGKAFDIIANVEIGPNLNGVVDRHDLRVGVRNLTQSTTIAVEEQGADLIPANEPRLEEMRLKIPAGWAADSGDVLQAVASYRVTAGANTDLSTAESQTFVVS